MGGVVASFCSTTERRAGGARCLVIRATRGGPIMTPHAGDIADELASLTDDELRTVFGGLTPQQREHVKYIWRLWARPDQLPPEGSWRVHLLLGGRASGKTRAASEFIRNEAESGRHIQIGVIGPTMDAVRRVQIEGPSGILAVAPPWCRPVYEPSTRRLVWPNGAIAHLFSGEEPERLRGPNLSLMWIDELCACAVGTQETLWNMAMMALRVNGPKGALPRCIVSTTPKATKLLREIVAAPTTVVTKSRTLDNAPNLDASTLKYLTDKYANTTLGRQELEAEILDDVEGAL